jgi:hypothetical protein
MYYIKYYTEEEGYTSEHSNIEDACTFDSIGWTFPSETPDSKYSQEYGNLYDWNGNIIGEYERIEDADQI